MTDANEIPAGQADGAADKRIFADPTKDFFVNMITRDISLTDCIFDLLDNSIDGARRAVDLTAAKPFDGFLVEISFSRDGFHISDNCGGISLADAINHAFHFGRKPDSTEVQGGIGLYGIGMKRALFKIGKNSTVVSHADVSFKVSVEVDEWLGRVPWDFEWDDVSAIEQKGTAIDISNLNPGIGETFGDEVFRNELIMAISRDYSFFIQKGLKIKVGDYEVQSNRYTLRSNDNVKPAFVAYEEDGVDIRVVAGLIEELSEEIPDDVRPSQVDRHGWYVVCNDRVVLAGDKTEKTVWGNDDFQVWHPQYAGFAGFVFFSSNEQSRLPWTTTKRDLDISSPLYRRTITKMKELTEGFIKYSNRRKSDLTVAKQMETGGEQVDVYVLAKSDPEAHSRATITLPSFAKTTSTLVTISYKKEKHEIDEIRKNEGDPNMTAKDVGRITFDYYRMAELGK